MKLLFIPGLIILSCGAVKTNPSATNTDVARVTANAEKNVKDSLITAPEIIAALPGCIKNKIDSFKVKARHEQPQRVVEYMYKGKKVYYVEMPCCDFFNEVYDDKCNFLGSPSGGFSGKGDGKLADFFVLASHEKPVWKKAD